MKLLKVFALVLSSLMISCFAYAADMKVGFIYIGPPGDHGWNYQHDVGRKSVDEAFGGKVETVFQENVPESADAERVMTQMALSGADMIFAEALYTLDDYRAFTNNINVPVLANLTEFGLTPQFTIEELADVGISIALYPLSAFRAMSNAALKTYETIRNSGTQIKMLDQMQTRDELYEVLNYHTYEEKLDDLYGRESRDD